MIRLYIGLLATGLMFSPASADASTYPNATRLATLQAAYGNILGNSTSVSIGTGQGTPFTTSAYGNTVGGSTLGNFGVSQAGTGVRVAGNVAVPLGNTGKAAAAVASAGASRAVFLRGLAAVAGPPGGMLALSLAAPAVIDWIESSGKYKVDPATGSFADMSGAERSDGYEYQIPSGAFVLSLRTACVAYSGADGAGRWNNGEPKCYYADGRLAAYVGFRQSACSSTNWIANGLCVDSATGTPVAWADIAAYMDTPEAPALTPAVLVEGVAKAGIDPFGGESPKVTVTGPATVPGASTTTTTQTRVIPGTTTEVGTGYSGETQPATRSSTQAATHNVTYNDNRVTYNTTNNTTTTVTNNVTGQTDTRTEETTTEDDAPDDSVTDTALGDIPKLYERKYPDGMVGIWNDKKAAMQGTSLMSFLSSVMPTGLNAGTCPAWSISINFGGVMNMGVHPIEVPCWLWSVVKAALIVSALLYARRLIFGG